MHSANRAAWLRTSRGNTPYPRRRVCRGPAHARVRAHVRAHGRVHRSLPAGVFCTQARTAQSENNGERRRESGEMQQSENKKRVDDTSQRTHALGFDGARAGAKVQQFALLRELVHGTAVCARGSVVYASGRNCLTRPALATLSRSLLSTFRRHAKRKGQPAKKESVIESALAFNTHTKKKHTYSLSALAMNALSLAAMSGKSWESGGKLSERRVAQYGGRLWREHALAVGTRGKRVTTSE